MELTAISFEKYKAFPARESIEVRPLTILIGRNNSGKSVITRLPLLLARSLSEGAESPLELEFNGLDFGASFLDLIHNRIPHGAVGVGATFSSEGESIEFWAKVQHFDEYKLQVVTHFELKQMDKPMLTLSWIGKHPLKEENAYRIEETGQNCQASFRGLFPFSIQPVDNGQEPRSELQKQQMLIQQTRNNLAIAMEGITYLGPFREGPKRMYRFPGGQIRDVGVSGAKAPELLASDYLHRGGRLLDTVSSWFSEHLGGWPLDLAVQGALFSLVLRKPDEPSVEINIVDVGTGIAQILPIVVQRQFKSVTGEGGCIEIVEQPELHLHPSAHTVLADLYVEAAKQPGVRFIIETHSENFLLRIRRRVAEGKLNPNKVIIYWIDNKPGQRSRVQPIHVEADGEVDTWPIGVFSEDFEEARKIRLAQREVANEGTLCSGCSQ